MGYSKLSRRVIKRHNPSGRGTTKLEIITPNMGLTKHVEKLKLKNNEKDTEGEL